MVKTWSADNPKAALMARKRAAIVDAALAAFLGAGYAEASVNAIAASAGVSIKTLYRHFESKDELFAAVMQAACGNMPGARRLNGRRPKKLRRPGMKQRRPMRCLRQGSNICAVSCPPNSWRSTASSPAMPTAFPNSAGDTTTRPRARAMPSSRAMSTCGRSGQDGRYATNGPPPGIRRIAEVPHLRRGTVGTSPTLGCRDRREGGRSRREHADASERGPLLSQCRSRHHHARSCGTTVNLMAAAVAGPTMPSTLSPPVRLWNSLTAASVSGPKMPSITRSPAYSGYAFLSRR